MERVYYLGPTNSYSHIIAQKIFTDTAKLISCNQFSEIVSQIVNTPHTLGILPIENSITSNVHENMDYLFKQHLTITYEAYLKIHLYLIGLAGSTLKGISKVYSHPKALSQCKQFLTTHQFSIQDTASTASAKDLILHMNDRRAAVIGSQVLAHDAGLTIISSQIADNQYNITRFLVLSSQAERIKGDKSSIIFTIPHKSGTLANLLLQVARHHINVTKIESRPIPGTDWEYQFWIDLEVDKSPIDTVVIDSVFHKYTNSYKILGFYEKGLQYES